MSCALRTATNIIGTEGWKERGRRIGGQLIVRFSSSQELSRLQVLTHHTVHVTVYAQQLWTGSQPLDDISTHSMHHALETPQG